jgi:hypothetical protein
VYAAAVRHIRRLPVDTHKVSDLGALGENLSPNLMIRRELQGPLGTWRYSG